MYLFELLKFKKMIKPKPVALITYICIFTTTFFFAFILPIPHCLAQNCNNGDLNMLNIPNCNSATDFNSSTSSPLNIDNNQTACTNVANSTFTINNINMTPNSNGGSTLIIRNNNNVTINNLTIQNNNNNANISIYVEAGSTLTILNGFNTPGRTRFVNYGTLNFGANPSGSVTVTVQNDNNLFQNAIGATMRFNSTLNFASGNDTRFINNGTVIAGTFTINSNSVRYIQGNNATTTIGSLSQNNQTDVLCVPNNTCAKFSVTTSIPQLNNQLTSSNGTNMGGSGRGQQIVCYQGTAANYRGGSPAYPAGIGNAFSTSCATNCPNVILPIELLYFSAKKVNNKIEITWATAQENNNQSFEIQRSTNGFDFITIENVQGKNDLQMTQEYKFFDIDFPNKQLYYRLKQIDLDGTPTYFKMVQVAALSDEVFFTIFPNPAQEKIEILFTKPINKAEVKIINRQGNSEFYKTVNVENQRITLNIDLHSGLYFLQIISDSFIQTKKILVNK